MNSTVLTQTQTHLKQANRAGIDLWMAGEYERALVHFETVQFLFDESEPAYLRNFLINLGITYRALGRSPEAVDCYMRAIEVPAEDEADYLDINLAIGNLANALLDLKRAGEAHDFITQAEEYFTRIYDQEHLGECLETRARIQRALGDRNMAIQTARRAVNMLFEFSEDSSAIGRAIRTLAMCWDENA
jgi:tetratricopeptide (TPR) repeat protein